MQQWQSDEFQSYIDSLDRNVARRRTARAMSMVLPTETGSPSSREAPVDCQEWAKTLFSILEYYYSLVNFTELFILLRFDSYLVLVSLCHSQLRFIFSLYLMTVLHLMSIDFVLVVKTISKLHFATFV